MKFTDKSIQSLKPKADRYEVWEDGKKGFGIRVSPQGMKSFVWMYRYEGKSKRLTLGNYPKMSLHDAGKALAEARSQLSIGSDPGKEVVQQRRDYRQAILVADLVVDYLEKHARPNKRSASEDERILNKDILPRWGNKKAKSITKQNIIELLDEILERGSPIAANRTLACIRKVFNWANSRDILDINPCLSVKSPSKENHRDRVLSDEEVFKLWHNLEKTNISKLIQLVLKLQLVTAQRKSEVLFAKWSEIDLSKNIWTIPIENSKNKLAHRVPLSSFACNILKEIKEYSGTFIYLFPSRDGNKTIQASSVDHALRNNRLILDVEDVTPHDLRRTAASHMASLGVNRLVISKVLNHVEQSVTSIYDRYSYDKEKQEALELWSKHLNSII